MTHDDRSLERAARSWLEEGPTLAPDRAVEAALARVQSTSQERGPWIPWRFPKMNPMIRLAAIGIVAAIAVGGAIYALLPASPVGPPAASPSPQAPPSIEGTWDVTFTRGEMLRAGIADQGEDIADNYGHFHLTLKAGQWQLVHLDGPGVPSVSTYTLDPGVVHLYASADAVTFDLQYTVTETTLTFGHDGPVLFRVKPWTRIATEPIAAPATPPGPSPTT